MILDLGMVLVEQVRQFRDPVYEKPKQTITF